MTTRESRHHVIARPVGSLSPGSALVAGYMPDKTGFHEQTFRGHAIGLVTEGSGTFETTAGSPVTVAAPFFFAVAPGGWARYGPGAGRTWTEYYLVLSGERIESWVRAGWLPPHGTITPLNPASAAAAASRHQQIVEHLDSGLARETDLARLLAEQWLHFLFYSRSAETKEFPLQERIREQVANWEAEVPAAPDLKSLARGLGVSYSHWRAVFRQTLGVSPYGYLRHLRIRRAADDLRTAYRSIKRIAYDAGFRNVETFDRAFRQFTGMTPTEWRRKTGSFSG